MQHTRARDIVTPGTNFQLQDIWLKGAYVVAGIHILFAFILIGVPGLSSFAAPWVFVILAWIAWGVAAKVVRIPVVLALPTGFIAFLYFMTLFDTEFPVIYAGKIFTIWVGGIAFATLVANGVRIKHVFEAFLVVALLNIIAIWLGYDGLQQNTTDIGDVTNLEEAELPRFSGLAGHPNLLSSIALLPLFLVLLHDDIVSIGKYLILLVGAALIVYYTGSRNALVLTAAFAVLTPLFCMQGTRPRILMLCISLPILIGGTIVLKSDTLTNMVAKSPAGAITIVKRLIAQRDGVEESSIARKQYQRIFFQHFSDAPVLGHGSEHFAKLSPHSHHAHNNYLELLINHGAIGLIAYYLLYLGVLYLSRRQDLFTRLKLAAVICVLIVADTWDVHYMSRIAVLLLCISLVVASEKSRIDALAGR